MSRWNLSQPPLADARKAPSRAAFNRIVIAGQPIVYAGSSDAPLILEAGTGVTLTADQDNDTVRIDAAVGGISVGAPVSPIDGDAWWEVSGASPSRSVALKYRDGSTTVTVAEVTY